MRRALLLALAILAIGCGDHLELVDEGEACDRVRQNCVEGLGCEGGTGVHEPTCQPVAPNAATLGEVCDLRSDSSAPLPCEAGTYCFAFDATSPGECVEYCNSDSDCTTGRCVDEWICLESCDPLDANPCPPMHVCTGSPDTTSPAAYCAPSAIPFNVGDECLVGCSNGLACIQGPVLTCVESWFNGCCSPYCDPTEPGVDATCPGAASGQVCVDLGEGFGVCAIP